MAPINNLSVLAFASTVFAVPHAQWQPFKRHAHPGAPPAYGSSAPAAPAYGSSSSAAPVSNIPVYGSASSAAPASSWGIPGYGSSSSYGPASSSISAYGSASSDGPASSWGIPGYGSSSSFGPASSSGIGGYGSSAASSGYPHPSGSSVNDASSGYLSTSICTETDTKIYRSTTEYSTYYVTHTVYESSSASAGPAASGYGGGWGAGASGSEAAPVPSGGAPGGGYDGGDKGAAACVPDVTVTTTERTTVYVTPGASSAGGVPSYAPADKGPSYGGGWGAPSKAAPEPSSAPAAPSSYAAPSGGAAPSWGAPSGGAAPSSYAAPSASAAPPSGGYSGKRGLAYNDASLCNAFAGSNAASFAYNWGSDSSGLDSSIPYIPMLWGPAAEFSQSWHKNAQAAIQGGAEYLFSFNEPDMSSQSNMSPQDAAEAWKVYMEPFAGQAKLVAPSVTNGQDANMGLGWLQQFLDACSDCTIDAFAQHWYFPTNDVQNFKDQVTQCSQMGGGKPVWVNEFGAIGSDEEKSDFLSEVMPWMDSNDSVL